MAGKFGPHLGPHRIIEDSPSENEKQLPPTPISSAHSSSSLASRFDYRASISTTRTSISGWSDRREGGLESAKEEPKILIQRMVKRSTGSYRLSDFIVQRTLGTGSFGRVHLGMSLFCLLPHSLVRMPVYSQYGANTICVFMRLKF